MKRWSYVLEIVAVALISVAVFGLAGIWWALLPVAIYLLVVSFTMFGGPEE
jgi:hypothetical protein